MLMNTGVTLTTVTRKEETTQTATTSHNRTVHHKSHNRTVNSSRLYNFEHKMKRLSIESNYCTIRHDIATTLLRQTSL